LTPGPLMGVDDSYTVVDGQLVAGSRRWRLSGGLH
jgi:hypothetical protein